MKTLILFSSTIFNLQNKTTTMKIRTHLAVKGTIAFLFLLSLNACQKDFTAPSVVTEAPLQTHQLYAIDKITSISDDLIDPHQPSILSTRGTLPDIEDELVIVVGGSINCIGNPDSCLESAIKLRMGLRIDVGQRIGNLSALTLNMGFNRKTCYRHYSEVGVMDMCGYTGKENNHVLDIKTDGNYRVQLSPKHTARNLDMFIYKYTPNYTTHRIDTALVAFSTLLAGKTETVHLTKKGYYTIVVDEHELSGTTSNYTLSVSENTDIKTTPILYNDDLIYQFQSIKTLNPNTQLAAWNFKRKINGVLTNLGNYYPNNTFSFSCTTCDYLVSPVYINTLTGNTMEGAATMIRP